MSLAADRGQRPAMRSPGRSYPAREVERPFWQQIVLGVGSEAATCVPGGGHGGYGDCGTLTGRRARRGAVRRVDAGSSGVQFHATVTSVLFHPDVVAAGEVLGAADGAVFSTLAW